MRAGDERRRRLCDSRDKGQCTCLLMAARATPEVDSPWARPRRRSAVASTIHRPSRISSRSASSFTSRHAWMRRGETRNEHRCATIEVEELAAPMWRPSAREAVDLLCVSKSWLG